MNTNASDSASSSLDSTLRSLDAAAETLTAAEHQQAATTLERILETPPTADTSASGRSAPSRRSRRRPVLIAGAAAAVGLLAATLDMPGGGRAYASWTPAPVALTSAELDLVAPVCRDELRKGEYLDMDRAKLVLSERRGEVVALLYRTDDPDMAGSCLLHNPPGTDEVEDLNWGVAGGTGPASTAPPRSFTQGAMATSREVTVTDGAVGAEVVGVTIHAPGGLTAQASVRNGRYVVWWPGPAYDVAKEGTAEAQPIITYDLTLTDGTTIHDDPPARPS